MEFLLPPSTWRPPVEFPQLEKVVAIDLETCDPELKDKGPGFLYGKGYVVGIAVADSTRQIYLPFAHEGGDNLPKALVIAYVNSILTSSDEVIMANAGYDLGFLATLGLSLRGIVRDVQVAEALIDEEQNSYSLNALCLKYLGRPKNEALLEQAANAFGVRAKDQLWKMPARYVGPYGEFDARATYDVFQKQKPILEKEGLGRVWEMECKITKIATKMSLKGVKVDLPRAEKLNQDLIIKEKELQKEFPFNIWATKDIINYCKSIGIHDFKITEKNNESADKLFLKNTNHPQLKKLLELRDLNRLRKVFIEDGILNGHYKGRIHCEFIQTTRDDGGTRSGRFSCRNPNLQQVPKRSSLGKIIRTLYTAEDSTLWCKCDYSSQEPRLQVHYALLTNLPRAAEAADSFRNGIKLYTFFEQVTGLSYDTCKMLCLGIGYGMGKVKMATTLGLSIQECEEVLVKFDEKAPFLRMLFNNTMAKANQTGVIKTIGGRHCHFDWWSTRDRKPPIKGLKNAQEAYPKELLTRSFVSKALNRLIQGSAADQTKLAMIAVDAAGIDMRLPVHDEINSIVPDEKTAKLQKELMETVINLALPVVADMELGSTWK